MLPARPVAPIEEPERTFEPARHRPYLPPRSRREYDEHATTAPQRTEDTEIPPLWTARGRRLAQEMAEAAARAAREAEAGAQRRAMEERRRAEEAEAARIAAGLRRMRRPGQRDRWAEEPESDAAQETPESDAPTQAIADEMTGAADARTSETDDDAEPDDSASGGIDGDRDGAIEAGEDDRAEE